MNSDKTLRIRKLDLNDDDLEHKSRENAIFAVLELHKDPRVMDRFQ